MIVGLLAMVKWGQRTAAIMRRVPRFLVVLVRGVRDGEGQFVRFLSAREAWHVAKVTDALIENNK